MSSASVKTHANITQSEGEGARCQKTNAATIQPMQTITSGTSVTSCRRTKSIMSIILHAIRRHYQLLLYITPVQISVSAHPALTIDTVSMYGPSAAQVGSNSILIIQGPEPALAGGLPGLGIHRSGKAAEGRRTPRCWRNTRGAGRSRSARECTSPWRFPRPICISCS
jgi:hypothetical protein